MESHGGIRFALRNMVTVKRVEYACQGWMPTVLHESCGRAMSWPGLGLRV